MQAAWFLARPAGLEPTTPGLEGQCSVRLSYGRVILIQLPPADVGNGIAIAAGLGRGVSTRVAMADRTGRKNTRTRTPVAGRR